MKDRSIYILIFWCLIFFPSFAKEEENTPKHLPNNKESDKVIGYFRCCNDSLKYKSALFLLSNMPFNYSICGDNIDEYEKACRKIAYKPKELRSKLYKQVSTNINKNSWKPVSDICMLNSQYLINYINKSVDNWENQTWSKEYSWDDFFNYVLPYRISNEPLSNWHQTIDIEYPYLNGSHYWSNRGIQFDFSKAILSSSDTCHVIGASKDKVVSLNQNNSKVSFHFFSEMPISKLINLQYSSVSDNTQICISLNGKVLKYCRLKPTVSSNHFQRTHFGIPLTLVTGNNEISIKLLSGNALIDYLELSAYEELVQSNFMDFSNKYYRIRNQETGRVVSLDTLSSSLLKPILLKENNVHDKSTWLQFDYQGYPCWKISPYGDTAACIENRWVSLEPMNELAKYNYIRANHQKWVVTPIVNKTYKIVNKESGLCWDFHQDKNTGEIILVQNIYAGKPSQHWLIEPIENRNIAQTIFKPFNAASAALKVTDIMSQFEYIATGGVLPPSLADLCKFRTGTCQEEATYTVAISRYLGIPTCIDFTPHWGNRTNSHSWCALILPHGKSVPFYMGCAPGDTAQYFHSYIKPKVYRSQFKLNQKIASDMKLEKSRPSIFQLPKFVDVTKEYCQTSDIERQVPSSEQHNIVYICVFDKEDWYPVAYSKVVNGKARFESMGRNILYSLGYWDSKKIIPIGNPFVITQQGKTRDIKVDCEQKQTVTLLRKYPFFGKEDFFNFRMNYGLFQGANKPDFSDAYTFYTHEGITEGCWYEQTVSCNKAFKYLRYLSPKDSYGNINELEFYNMEGNKLRGDIIGTDGLPYQGKETVFDGNILTGFNSNIPNGNWVGIKLLTPSKVSKIKYIPRNDGNCIEIGDYYQLLYYKDGGWKAVSEKSADANIIRFSNVPVGGLYLLKDLTKGNEERIFTYEDGKQVWW